MLKIDEVLHRTWGSEVADGLRRLTEPPDWLLALDDPKRISAALVERVPEFRDGDRTIRDCEVLRVRLRGDSWVGQYRLEVAEGEHLRTVDLIARSVDDDVSAHPVGGGSEPFGSEGWRCHMPELGLEFRTQPGDIALATLPALTDPEEARVLIEHGIRGSSPKYADLRIEACRPKVMRYKPGSRCTVLYDVQYPEAERERRWPDPVIAKTHHGPKGRNAHEAMVALWSSPLRHSGNVAIAEPLGFLPEENVLLQGPLKEERTLKQQLRLSLQQQTRPLEELRTYVEKTARGLADLHGCGAKAGDTWTFEEEMGEVRDRVARLTKVDPRLAGVAEPLFTRLQGIAEAHPADPAGPAHRSFRPAQVLIHEGAISFIDFDSFCQAEPALDVSLFFSTFRDLGLRALQAHDGVSGPGAGVRSEHLSLLDDLSDTFLKSYEETASLPISRARVDLWHALLVFDRVVLCWTKDRFERLPHCLALLSHLYRSDGLTRLLG